MTRPGSNSKLLVAQALQGQRPWRVPTGPLAVHFCARVAGRTLRAYSTQARVLAECVLRYYERFRPDALWLSADTWVSAEAMGAPVGAAAEDQPLGGIGPPVVRTPADMDRLTTPDLGRGRYPLMLEALTRVVDAVGKDVFIVACCDQYPFALAAALMGLQAIMLKTVDDPPFIEALMHHCAEYQVAYGRALAAAGADMISGGDSPAGLIGPELYQRLALPAEKRVIARIKAATEKPVSLHICGQTTSLLAAMASSGADVLELDHWVDLGEACRALGPGIGIWGNLDPVGLLAQATPAAVAEAARQAVGVVHSCGHHRFVLSSGCTLAMETPFDNLDALINSNVH
jgi:uroporphyrinogen decarboxylase